MGLVRIYILNCGKPSGTNENRPSFNPKTISGINSKAEIEKKEALLWFPFRKGTSAFDRSLDAS